MRRGLVPENVLHKVKAVRWFPSTGQQSSIRGQMFQYYQDVHVRIAPIGGRSHERADFKVRVEPDTKASVDRVLRAIHACVDTPSGRLDSDVCDFISREAAYLLLTGRAVHERIVDDDGNVYFFPLPPGRLLQLGPWVGQVVPANPLDHKPRRTIWLRRSDLWWLEPPAGLGSHALRHLRNVLRNVNYVPPGWSLPSLERPTTDFDLKAWRYETDVLVGRAVRSWGYPNPNPMQSEMTDFLVIREQVRFAVTMTRLREHMIGELNRELANAHDPARVVVEGLPSESDLEQTLLRLNTGEIAFLDALAMTRW